MRNLSVFVDESGDCGVYNHISPYYIVILVFHDQSNNLTEEIKTLDSVVSYVDIPERAIHAGPLIRRESDYRYFDTNTRRKIFDSIFDFARKIPFSYTTLIVEKRQIDDPLLLIARLSKQLSAFLTENTEVFSEYDNTIVYYDNGQLDLTKILVSVFSTALSNVEFRKAFPSDYKLFQVADLLCTLELLSLKYDAKALSNSEKGFFPSLKKLRKLYIQKMRKKRFSGKFL
ncbi:MAG: DUF3800 domain-containing protein [Clostridiales Family XIII bacterium]|jgi:hypothetical protein|nr:DUF3800 domain-containing protein [Clostridiales Family XIII bacterium]